MDKNKPIKKIKFVDFWDGYDQVNNLFYKVLSEKYTLELSDDPDYLFCSCFGKEHSKYNCVKIYYTGEAVVPNFNIYDYGIGFDHIKFGDRYLRFPLYALETDTIRKLEYRAEHLDDINIENRKFCSMAVSNPHDSTGRKDLFNKLSQYKSVDSGGKVLNNVGGPVKDKFEFYKEHKFCIEFENTSYLGYITEKIVDAYNAGCIPIYRGAPDVTDDFNPNSFINGNKYDSLDELVEVIKEIDNDDEKYLSMLRQPVFNKKIDYEQQLRDFLYYIFDQEPIDAKRIANSNFTRLVLEEEKDIFRYRRLYRNKFTYFIKRILNKIKRII